MTKLALSKLALSKYALSKYALPVLVVFIVALFSYSVSSQSNDATPDMSALRAELTKKLADVEKVQQDREKVHQDREQQLMQTIDSLRAELKRMSDDGKATGDKIAQTVMLRSDLLKLIEDSKSGSDKAAQIMLDQIDALRSDQVKFLKDAKEAGDKAAQTLRQEVAASQAKLAAQIGDTLKTSIAPNEALVKRVDAIRKDLDGVKSGLDEEAQNASNISPGLALVVALVALVLGPAAAYRITTTQLAAARHARQFSEASVAAAQPEADHSAATPAATDQTAAAGTTTADAEPPLVPSAAAQPRRGTGRVREATPDKETGTHQGDDGNQPAAPDPEKV